MTTASLEKRARDRIAERQRAELDQAMQELQAEDERTRHEQARQAHIAQLRERITVELDPAPLDAAEAELAAALDRYMAVCVAHDKRFSPLWTEVSNLAGNGPLPADLAASHIYGGMISAGGVDYRKSRLHTRLVRAAQAALDKARPLDHVDLSRNPQD